MMEHKLISEGGYFLSQRIFLMIIGTELVTVVVVSDVIPWSLAIRILIQRREFCVMRSLVTKIGRYFILDTFTK